MNRTFSTWTRMALALAVPAWLLAVPAAAQGSHGGGQSGGGGGHASAPAPAPAAPAPSSGGTSSGSSGSSGGGGSHVSSGGSTSHAGSGGDRASGVAVSRGGGGSNAAGSRGSNGGDRASGGHGAAERGPGGPGAPGVTGPSTNTGQANGSGAGARDRAVVRGAAPTSTDPVPPYSRPRDGKPTIGQAVPRTSAPAGGGGISTPGYYGGYYPWGFGGLGFGYGYYGGYYDPFDPYGGGYGGGYGPYGGYPDPGTQSSPTRRYDEGSLRLKIKPSSAAVYVDGNYTGVVDDFNGIFQRMHLDAGPHRIEVRAPGYETLAFDVRIEAERTTTYKGELKKLPN
jgi:hypothetical protein